MQRIIFIAICLCLFVNCAAFNTNTNPQNSTTDTRVIINTGIYAHHGHIAMFDYNDDQTPDYFEYYMCHPLWSDEDQLFVKQSDGTYRFGNHNCTKKGYADFRVKYQ